MKTDAQIQEDVINQLKWNPALNAAEIGVAVKNGVVTLSGHVDTYLKKMEAEREVKKVYGVRAIAEDIRVGISAAFQKPDSEIAEAVLNALKWHTSLKENNIRIKVEDGIVSLEGEVEWAYQREAAKTAIINFTGVKNVINNINIKPTGSLSDIKHKINSAFHRSANIDGHRIQIEVFGCKVVLKGKVRSFAEKEDAEDAVWAAPGVLNVENNLEVEDLPEYSF